MNVGASIRSIRATIAISIKGTDLVLDLDSFYIEHMSTPKVSIDIKGIPFGGWILEKFLNGLILPLVRHEIVKLGQDQIKKKIKTNIAGKKLFDVLPIGK